MMRVYVAGPVERFGRRIKVEYLGMASVYTIIALLFFHDLAPWHQSVLATVGAFFLFLGLKKKTEDHLVGSLVLLAAVSLAQDPIHSSHWVLPYMLFGLEVFIMEGYRERRPTRIYALPVLFPAWSLVDASWLLGLVFAAFYLTFPRAEKPHLRRHLAVIMVISALTALFVQAAAHRSMLAPFRVFLQGRVPLKRAEVGAMVALGVPALMCLAAYWRRLLPPHRFNTLLFAFLAPLDGRFAALFGMVASVTLCATVFRDSVDSPVMRPFFKHFEWHYFWYVFALAVWAAVSR